MKIIIIDDHNLFAEGISKVIRDFYHKIEVLIFNSLSALANQKIAYTTVDFLITDIELPNEDIFEFLENLKKRHATLPVLVVSMHNKLTVIKKCKAFGIEGYILKDDNDSITEIMSLLLKGKTYYSKKALKTLEILNKKEQLLTPKEEQILKMLVKNLDNHQIANKLSVSYHTIKTHRKNIYQKLEISTLTELLNYYYKNYVE
jgi:DNA-binding NarL/FixJ family response regulator